MLKEPQNNKMKKVLFLCTGNSCRSIMAEGLMNTLGNKKFQAFSAGSKPVGEVHPKALATLGEHGVELDSPRSKSWDEFKQGHIDLVVTVCKNAANETCPVFPGAPDRLSWFIEDPALATGTDEEIQAAFDVAFFVLKEKIENLIDDHEKNSREESVKFQANG